MATAIAYIGENNSIIKQTKVQTMKITFLEAELMVICSGLIYAMEDQEVHEIIVITDSLTVVKRYSSYMLILSKSQLSLLHLKSKNS